MSISTSLLGNDAIAAAIKSGNINIAGAMQFEVMELSNESKDAQIQHAEILRKYESQKRGRTIVVPTAIDDVKSKLRELGVPVTLFGEGHADRRERLREVIANLEIKEEEISKIQDLINQSSTTSASSASSSVGGTDTSKQNQKEVFYSPAGQDLIIARKSIFNFSLKKVQERLNNRKKLVDNPSLEIEDNRYVSTLYGACRDLALNSSQFGDDRPLSCVRYAPNGRTVATGSLSCYIKLWDISDLGCVDTLRGHVERITAVAWNPESQSLSQGGRTLLASSSADGTCKIWDCSGIGGGTGGGASEMDVDKKFQVERSEHSGEVEVKMEIEGSRSSSEVNGSSDKSRIVHTLKGHQGVVTACDFHPSGSIIGTASADYTWRLWDVESGKELLLQDGHIKDCTAISFQPDGSLILTADAAGVALLWDLRSGQQIQVFQGHVKKITSATFNPNGFQVATGSIDNMVRIWDLRKKKCSYCLPAHSNLISDLRYSKSGELLLTSSFDGTAKVWGSRDYQLLRSLAGHLGKVMACDFSPLDERHVVSAGFDRTLKLWAHKDEF